MPNQPISRVRRFARPALALIAAGALVLAVAGCSIVKPGSFTVGQPGGVGSVRVHFNLCTTDTLAACGPNGSEAETLQYLVGIAVPPGSTPPASFTAVPVGGGAPITFTRNDEVAPEMAASSVAIQKLLAQAETPEEKAEAEAFRQVLGDLWPPSGLEGVGYLSTTVQEFKEQSVEWSVDADFGLPAGASGAPFAGPFNGAIAFGIRVVSGTAPESRPVRCIKLEGEVMPNESEAFCSGTTQRAQVASADLLISPPKKPAPAFVGGSGELAFSLKYASTAPATPTFALSATTSAKGGKAKANTKNFKPGTLDATTHQAPNGTSKVTVTVPKKVKPGTYSVTLNAKAPQGGVASAVGKLKVTKPKLKFGKVTLNTAKGTATLKVKVPGAGKLTVTGKGVKKAKKKAKKAKTLKIKLTSSGAASATLAKTGSLKVKVKATFKPTSGISVSKKKSVVLKLR